MILGSEAVERVDLADALAVDKQQQRQFGLEGRVAQLDGLADVLAGDLEEAAVPADGAVVADLLRLQQHAALAQRVVAYTQLTAKTQDPRPTPALVNAMLDHGLAAAAAPPDLITPEAREMLIRATHGIPRLISHILRISLILADERGQSSIDPAIVNTATILLHLEPPKPIVMPPPRPRSDRDPRSRG